MSAIEFEIIEKESLKADLARRIVFTPYLELLNGITDLNQGSIIRISANPKKATAVRQYLYKIGRERSIKGLRTAYDKKGEMFYIWRDDK